MEFVIPEELLVNILVRLRIKDILRSKLVCKSWLRLISSSSSGPYFTSNYARNSPFFLIFRAQGDPISLSLSLLEFTRKNGGEHTQIPLLTPKIPDHPGTDSCLSFIGSCDCSVFILHHKRLDNDHMINRVYSFNPVSGSRVVKLVADEEIIGETDMWKYRVGFIPSNNTYKLVRFVPGKEKVEKAEIFTVGKLDENWRKVDDPLLFCGTYCNYLDFGQLICFKGGFLWVSFSKHGGNERIFTFDLLEEKCGAGIRKPHGVSRLSSKTTRLTILKDRLSVADLIDKYPTMVIWTMREYGVVESWSKFIVLTFCHTNRDLKWRYFNLVPIVVLENGDILFSHIGNCGGMFFYDIEEKQLVQIESPNSEPFYRHYENTYVPRFYTSDS